MLSVPTTISQSKYIYIYIYIYSLKNIKIKQKSLICLSVGLLYLPALSADNFPT